MPINALASVSAAAPLDRAGSLMGQSTAPANGGKSFGQMLSDALADVNKAQVHAADMSSRLAAGDKLDVHQVMIAAQEASVSLNLALQVRNKLVDAYQEVMRVNM